MAARILKASQIEEAAALLRAGKLVAFPTDTVYGVAALADGGRLGEDPDSAPLRAFKGGRPEPFSLHCGSLDQGLGLLPQMNAGDVFAIRELAPKGVTLVLRWARRGLGVRIVQHALGSSLLETAAVPVLATSANLHGQPTLRTAQDIAGLPGVDAVLDGGTIPERPASTVVRLLPSGLQLLRAGAMDAAAVGRAFTRSIQFVCLGNLNRSTFAQRLVESMQSWLAARLAGFVPAWHARSSGLIANPSQPVPDPMARAGSALGVSLEGHKPSRFVAGDARDDLLVAMGDDVAQSVETVAQREFFNLRVADPMGGPAAGYAECAREIARRLRHSLLSEWAPAGKDDARLESEFEKLFSAA